MDKDKIQAELKEFRRKKVEQLMLETLGEMLKEDVKFFDTHYIKSRTLQILEETIKNINFKNKNIEEARLAFLDVIIDGIKENIVGFKKEEEDLKKKLNTKDKEQKAKVASSLKRIQRLIKGMPRDKTEERDYNCEPVCQYIAKKLFDKEFVLKNKKFMKQTIEYDNELLVAFNVINDLEELFVQLYDSIDESYLRANEKKWGCTRENIKMSDLDNVLKS